MMDSPLDRPTFIVGAPRSGTTLLGRALGLSPGLAYLEESGIFVLCGARRFPGKWHAVLAKHDPFDFRSAKYQILALTDRLRKRDRLRDAVELVFRHRQLRPWNLQPSNPLIEVQETGLTQEQAQEVDRVVAHLSRVDDFREFIRGYFVEFMRCNDGKRLLEKTPDHIEVVPVIREVFPDARIVLVRRDKRDTIASYLTNFDPSKNIKNRFRSTHSLIRQLCRSCNYYQVIENWMAKQPWALTLNYRELVSEPHSALTNLVEHLGVSLPDDLPSLLQPKPAKSRWETLSRQDRQLIESLLKPAGAGAA